MCQITMHHHQTPHQNYHSSINGIRSIGTSLPPAAALEGGRVARMDFSWRTQQLLTDF
jgi:hypothetical protein